MPDMELWNISQVWERPLPNCTVDTSYRFAFYQTSYSVIFLLGLVTNGLALRRLCLSPCTMNSTAVYMASLTAADLFFVVSLPMRIYYYHLRGGAAPGWTPGAAFCHLTFSLKYVSLYGGIFFLVCIAVDRYLAVVRPLGSSRRRLRAARLLSGGIWCLVLLLSAGLPLLRSAAARRDQPCLLDPALRRHRAVILAALGLVQGCFLLPAALLLYSYCRVLGALRRPPRRRPRRHTLTIIYRVLAVFLLCFLPYHVNLLGYTLTHLGLLRHCGLARLTRAAHPVVLSLASSNCCLNPLVYYFSSSLAQRDLPSGGASGSQ